ncbi:UPF0146 family protein [Methanocaldococcus fervens]|uniref:UPF0146 protein Mefer_0613 n=1 Tax=Methanocaldococcus fervens (strain DSM 4213 / JCM 15782 / AG86) TaxID=573064 RepID=C7P7A2_METFA|nr:UPF0146 family protein [Methanocaldococcus fervens]ACV24434.1 Protein of unknown function UPF0146 [Methanocaldococcus fervens AG86]
MNVEVITEFIKNFAEENNCKKITEVGIGFKFDVARELNNYFNLIVVDINEKAVKKAKLLGLNAYKDDLFNPNINLYEDVDLIYSIRPPRDLQPYILELSEKINANLIIRPLLNETPIKELKLKNYKGEVFYIKE